MLRTEKAILKGLNKNLDNKNDAMMLIFNLNRLNEKEGKKDNRISFKDIMN